MRYTPVELRHVRLGRVLCAATSAARDRQAAGGRRRQLRGRLARARRARRQAARCREDARRGQAARGAAGVDARLGRARGRRGEGGSAKREAELIVAEAHGEARSVTRAAQAERERLFAEARRVETLLRAALGMIEESQAPPQESAEPGARPRDWPRREDTREFQPVAVEDATELRAGAVASRRQTDEEDEPCPGAISPGGNLRRVSRVDARSAARLARGAARSASSGGTATRGRCASRRRPRTARRTTAVVALLADTLALPTRDVSIVSGHASRDKTVALRGIDPERDRAAARRGERRGKGAE